MDSPFGSKVKPSYSLHDKEELKMPIWEAENKEYLFSSDERIQIVKKALFSDLKLNKKKIEIISFTSLTTDLCRKYKSNIILRGLRAVSDFEYEFQLAGMNRKLNINIETISTIRENGDAGPEFISYRYENGPAMYYSSNETTKSSEKEFVIKAELLF